MNDSENRSKQSQKALRTEDLSDEMRAKHEATIEKASVNISKAQALLDRHDEKLGDARRAFNEKT